MKIVMDWIVDHRWSSWLIILVIMACLCPGVLGIHFDSSTDNIFPKSNPNSRIYREMREAFGDDITLRIVIKSRDIFQPDILQAILDLSDEALSFEGVTRVVSLATVNNLKGRDGVLNTEGLLIQVPETKEELANLRSDALGNDIYIGEVVNAKGTAAVIHTFIEPYEGKGKDKDYKQRLVNQVQKVIDRTQKQLGDKVEIFQCGSPYLITSVLKSINKDLKLFIYGSLVVLLGILYLFFRSFSAVIIPCITGISSVVMTLGLMGVLGYSINPLTVIIPMLLMVLGCTEDIHMLAEYGDGIRDKLDRNAAIRNMARKSGLAILLTSLTTFLGFATIIPNALPSLHQFGVAASLGMLINFVVTILMVPHMLSWFKPKAGQLKGDYLLQKVQVFIFWALFKNKKVILILTSLILAAAIGGSFLMEIDTSYTNLFKKDSDIRKSIDDMTTAMGSNTNFYIVIKTDEDGGIQKPEVLENIVKLNDFLSDRFDKALGYTSFLRKLHQEMNDGNPEFYKLPQSKDLIAQYTLLLNQDDLARFVDYDLRRACIFVRGDIVGSKAFNEQMRTIRRFIDSNLSKDLKYDITGETALTSLASETISRELILNLAYMLGAIFILTSLLFMSLKAGLLALGPNILPIAVNFAIMGLFGIPLGISIFPVALVALGVAVDDTIHLMVRYSKEVRKHEDNESAMRATLTKELRPVLSTTFAITMGFLVLVLADFGSIVHFGILIAIVMVTALLSDLFITPALLLTTPLVTTWDFLQLRIGRELTENSLIFKELSLGEIKRVAVMSEIKKFKPGEHLITEGVWDRDMFVLLKGSCEVCLGESSKVLRHLGVGEMVGEMSFLSKKQRSASVVALDNVEAIVINAETLDRVRARFPKVGAKVFFNISRMLGDRLRDASVDLARTFP